MINTRINDTDDKCAEEIVEEFKNTIQLLKIKYDGIKIIISEITQRKNDKDKVVIECNRILSGICKDESNMFLISHDNLRDDTYSKLYDTKHIHYRAVGLFVSNIKQEMRKAYGIVFDKKKVYNKAPHINTRNTLRKLPPKQRRHILVDI